MGKLQYRIAAASIANAIWQQFQAAKFKGYA